MTRKENRRTVKYSGELTHMYVHQYIFPVHWGKIQIFLVLTAMSKHFVNVTATRVGVGWLLNGMCSSKKYPYPPPPGISTQGVLIITCPTPRTFVILFMSWRQLLHKLSCKPWKMHSTELKQKIAFSFEISRGHPLPPWKLSLFRPPPLRASVALRGGGWYRCPHNAHSLQKIINVRTKQNTKNGKYLCSKYM